uniref:Solute carrier family 24 member 6a n=1 Tax=Lepisosteus oculatus TaxID=7918 RepID=W5M455_LEPOC
AVYMFYALAIVCDDYFVPSLEKISENLQLSEDVAGATFMAAGSSAPELFTSLIGVFITKGDVGVGTIVGSAVFNILVIIGVCGLFAGQTVLLTWWSLFRDSIYYTFSVLALILVSNRALMCARAVSDTLSCALYPQGDCVPGQCLILSLLCSVPTGGLCARAVSDTLSPLLCTHRGTVFSGSGGCVPGQCLILSVLCSVPTGGPCSLAVSDTLSSALYPQGGCVPGQCLILCPVLCTCRGAMCPSLSCALYPQGDCVPGQCLILSLLCSVPAGGLCARAVSNTLSCALYPQGGCVPGQCLILSLLCSVPTGGLCSRAVSDTLSPVLCTHRGAVCPCIPAVGLCARVKWLVSWPLSLLLYCTVPNCILPRWHKWFMVTFLMSTLWIAIFSYVMVWMVTIISYTLGIPDVIMGITFLAAGTSVPDCMASLIVARQGMGDMAVSNSIGSNIFDILLGLGFPWAMQTLVVDYGSSVFINSKGLLYSVILLLASVFLTVLGVHLNHWRLDRKLGLSVLTLYAIFLLCSILIELNVLANLPACL